MPSPSESKSIEAQNPFGPQASAALAQRVRTYTQEAPTTMISAVPVPSLPRWGSSNAAPPGPHVVATSHPSRQLEVIGDDSLPPAPTVTGSLSRSSSRFGEGDLRDNRSTPGLAFFSKTSQPASSDATPDPTTPQGRGVAQPHQKATPTSLPTSVTPKSTTSTSFSDAFGTAHDLGVHPLPSPTIDGQLRPTSLASSLDAGVYATMHLAPLKDTEATAIGAGTPLKSDSVSTTSMEVSHTRQELVDRTSSSVCASAQPAPTTRTPDMAHKARLMYISIYGRPPTDDELLWLSDPCRQGPLATSSTSYHPTVVLTPDTPGSQSSTATSAQYVLAREDSEDLHSLFSVSSDPFRANHSTSPPVDTDSLGGVPLKSHFSSDSDLASPGGDEDLGDVEGDDEVDEDEIEREGDGDGVDSIKWINEDGLEDYDINGGAPMPPSTPPRRPPRPHDHKMYGSPSYLQQTADTSPTQRVEQRVYQSAVARIHGDVQPKPKKKRSGWLLNLRGKGKEKEEAGLVEKLGEMRVRLLPQPPFLDSATPRALVPQAPPPLDSIDHLDLTRNAIDLDPATIQPTLAPPLPKLRSSRSEVNMGNRFTRRFRGSSAGPAASSDDIELLQVEFWLKAPFLDQFLATRTGPRSIIIPGCDGTPDGHHAANGTKICSCPSESMGTVVDLPPKKEDQQKRRRQFAESIVAHIRVTLGRAGPSTEGGGWLGLGKGGSYF